MKKLLTLLLCLILLMQTMVITLAEEAYKVEIDSEGFLLDNMENEEQNLEVVIDANEECLIDAMNTISLDDVIMPEVEPIELDSIESFDANVFESTEPDLTMENASNVAIDREHFPDKILRNYISMNYDIDQDGSLSEKERKEVTKLAIYNMGINNVTGIELFPNLSTLICWGNNFTSLDVSNLESLQYLSCGGNSEYSLAPLSSLNVRGCSNLESLSCGCSKLQELYLDGCINLNYILCSHSQLRTIDVSDCTNLQEITCKNNKINELYLGGCPNLSRLSCEFNELTELDLSENPAIEYLDCNNNPIVYLNVSNRKQLRKLNCKLCSMAVLRLEDCPNLSELNCSECELRGLFPTGCYNLTEIYCFSNELKEMDLSACSLLKRLNCAENQLVDLNISNSKDLSMLVCEHNYIKKLDVSKNDNLYRACSTAPVVKDKVASWGSLDSTLLSIDTYTSIMAKGELVFKATDKIVPTLIMLNKTSPLSLEIGKTLTLKATVEPSSAETTFTWKSTNPKVATVSDKGVVTAIKEGTTTISVTTDNGLSTSVKVNIIATKPTSVIITKGDKATLYMGNKLTLKAKLEPNKSESMLTWKSSKPKIAEVSEKGVVTPKKAGRAIITVKTTNGKKDSIIVTVVDVKSVKLKEGKAKTLKVGKKLTLHAIISPSKVKTTFTWTSSNKKIATVSSKGVVKAIKPGKAKITVKTANGKKATVKITVKKK